VRGERESLSGEGSGGRGDTQKYSCGTDPAGHPLIAAAGNPALQAPPAPPKWRVKFCGQMCWAVTAAAAQSSQLLRYGSTSTADFQSFERPDCADLQSVSALQVLVVRDIASDDPSPFSQSHVGSTVFQVTLQRVFSSNAVLVKRTRLRERPLSKASRTLRSTTLLELYCTCCWFRLATILNSHSP
jgi:hypothetical protein